MHFQPPGFVHDRTTQAATLPSTISISKAIVRFVPLRHSSEVRKAFRKFYTGGASISLIPRAFIFLCRWVLSNPILAAVSETFQPFSSSFFTR